MRTITLDRLIEIATALTTEKNVDRILERILDEAMMLTACDAGTVYVRDGNVLRFHTVVTLSKNVRLTSRGGEDVIPPVPMTRSHVCACAAMDGEQFNIPDVYTSERFDFTGAQRYDKLNGYRTKSMLVIPMEDENGTNIGVIQLINAMDDDGEIVPFDQSVESVIAALGSLASVTLNNNMLSRAVFDILHSFVEVMVDAIDARTAYNANHTRSMVRYAGRFLKWLDDTEDPYRIPKAEQDAFLMSVWLHDIGKLIIPASVMDKPTRLGDRERDVSYRIETGILMEKIRALSSPDEKGSAEAKIRELQDARDEIARANGAGFIDDATGERLAVIGGMTALTADGAEVPLLTPEEMTMITVRRGTLTADERAEMERHVVYTARFLSKMKFRGVYSDVPAWASGHHELLDGSGYPNHASDGAIPKEVRIITILDIYDALTAEDRPYKPPMETEKAFSILSDMAEKGKLDKELLTLFRESGAWKKEDPAASGDNPKGR